MASWCVPSVDLTLLQFELLYSPGLFPSPRTPPDAVRRYRQNFLSNAREVIRITGGKSIILSSGANDSDCGVRGPLDVINLATMLGMPANLAKDAISLNPKKVLLNARKHSRCQITQISDEQKQDVPTRRSSLRRKWYHLLARPRQKRHTHSQQRLRQPQATGKRTT